MVVRVLDLAIIQGGKNPENQDILGKGKGDHSLAYPSCIAGYPSDPIQ